jgi:uncharacterized membrane protein
MSNKERIRKIAVTAALSALTIVLGLTGFGFIVIPPLPSITIMHVPVILGALLEGPIVGATVGLLFGVFSVIQATLIGSAADAVFATYPLVAILPRIAIGLAAWGIFRLINGKPHAKTRIWRYTAAVVAGAIAGSLTNTILVLGSFGVLKLYPWEMIGAAAALNGPLEAAAAAIISGAVIAAWYGVTTRKGSKLFSE